MTVPTDLHDRTVTERARLADLLDRAGPEAMNVQSLCALWRVRGVIAHLNASETQTYEQFLASITAAEGDMNSAINSTVVTDLERFSDEDLLTIYRERVPSNWTPGPDNWLGALSHEIIHGLDITVPLGLPGPDPESIALVLADPKAHSYFGVDLENSRLIASDTELAVGPEGGCETTMPAADILTIVAGRRPVRA